MKLLRALGTLLLTATLTVAAPAAFAADPPPTTSTGFAAGSWGDPIDNDLFTLSGSRWKGTVGIGAPRATTSVLTLTAKTDLTMQQGTWSDEPDGMAIYRSGTCPASVWSQTITMAAGDTCQIWVSYGPDTTDEWSSYISGLHFTATTSGGATASEYVGLENQVQHVLPAAPLDFGEVPLGTTSAPGSIAVQNITPDEVRVELTYLTSMAPFHLADDQPATFTIQPGATADVQVTFTPTALGRVSEWWNTLATVTTVGGTAQSTPRLSEFIGTGVERQAGLTAGPVDFGEVTEGDTVQQPIAVTNTGAVPLRLSTEDVQSAGAETVEVALPTDEVAPGQTVTGTVTWHGAGDDLAATVRVNGDDSGAAPAAVTPATTATELVALTGTVAAPSAPEPTTPPTIPPTAPEKPATPDTTTGATTATTTRLAITGSGSTAWILGVAAGAVLLGTGLVAARRVRRATR
ncbi:choice-of-anchor D domain-containing protein [Cellulomonas denverensis]|uniref:Choice-of-anchor D domain-containing protein n=1 Tax=Cellulomonas denverensis TaxID=264297 RepID=A0A7X6KXV1_9CELL|nr:choice-of-anchor D domain-containing protein [Cellulomonas denverensis]NKY24207.1 choice-of-anchor D domain-containing protein [Cellulomonas denverensis]GIG24878.1 hypothetical protein Cde04nite_11220 [Cellulomonas denverensis]